MPLPIKDLLAIAIVFKRYHNYIGAVIKFTELATSLIPRTRISQQIIEEYGTASPA